MKSSSSLQEFVDTEYPPTHTYDIASLKPTGVLKERVELINEVAPDFFKGKRFLDIGCNKGFFSRLASNGFHEAVGIDSHPKYVDLCKRIHQKPNTAFFCTSFRDFTPDEEFDKIFLGNVHHHLFLEVNGWEWISKLATLSSGEVLIEGPIDTSCLDVKKLVPNLLHSKFNEFLNIMTKFFALKRLSRTVSYTPRRYLMLFERKPTTTFELYRFAILQTIKSDPTLDFNIFVTVNGYMKTVMKVSNLNTRNAKMRIRIASLSPFSNGMMGEIYEGEKWMGWLEKYEPHRPFRYFENERELFTLYCQHQIFLAKLGYTDLDPATINFFTKTKKLFDKSQVFPIKTAPQYRITDFYPTLFNQSYRTIGLKVLNRIVEALETRNSRTIEYAFTEILKG